MSNTSITREIGRIGTLVSRDTSRVSNYSAHPRSHDSRLLIITVTSYAAIRRERNGASPLHICIHYWYSYIHAHVSRLCKNRYIYVYILGRTSIMAIDNIHAHLCRIRPIKLCYSLWGRSGDNRAEKEREREGYCRNVR